MCGPEFRYYINICWGTEIEKNGELTEGGAGMRQRPLGETGRVCSRTSPNEVFSGGEDKGRIVSVLERADEDGDALVVSDTSVWCLGSSWSTRARSSETTVRSADAVEMSSSLAGNTGIVELSISMSGSLSFDDCCSWWTCGCGRAR